MIAPRPSRSRWLIGSSVDPSSIETSTSILSSVFIDIIRLTVPAGAIHCEEDAQFMVIEALTTLPSAPAEPAPNLRRPDKRPVEWLISAGTVDYPEALATMRTRAAAIAAGEAGEAVWLVEHPPLNTAGTSAVAGDLLLRDRFPVYDAGRGGQYTYHGPGQRVAYVMLDLRLC